MAKVDQNRRPVPGTEEFIPCDTLLLSVGLIPENELSRNVGIKMDKITRGPVVDESRETSREGVFACGNVLQVHDLVDYVTKESQTAGEGAARYILNQKDYNTAYVRTRGINGVRYVVPQKVNLNAGRDVSSISASATFIAMRQSVSPVMARRSIPARRASLRRARWSM